MLDSFQVVLLMSLKLPKISVFDRGRVRCENCHRKFLNGELLVHLDVYFMLRKRSYADNQFTKSIGVFSVLGKSETSEKCLQLGRKIRESLVSEGSHEN